MKMYNELIDFIILTINEPLFFFDGPSATCCKLFVFLRFVLLIFSNDVIRDLTYIFTRIILKLLEERWRFLSRGRKSREDSRHRILCKWLEALSTLKSSCGKFKKCKFRIQILVWLFEWSECAYVLILYHII